LRALRLGERYSLLDAKSRFIPPNPGAASQPSLQDPGNRPLANCRILPLFPYAIP